MGESPVVIYDQAENRLHVQKAALALTLLVPNTGMALVKY
jgi:ornithine carbamoyltransferase